MATTGVKLDERERRSIAVIVGYLRVLSSADRRPTQSEAIRYALRYTARRIIKRDKQSGKE